jgi:hypothetical protein
MTNKDNARALAVYGDRGAVKELSERLTRMLPSVRELGPSGALALAQVAHAMGLNPFTGEIWAIPQRRGGEVVGFSVMAGIKGLRRAARHQAQQMGAVYPFYRVSYRTLTDDEKDLVGLREGDKGLACQLELVLPPDHAWYTAHQHERFIVEGLGVYRSGERTQMEPFQVVRKRAEADALKIAFDLPFGDLDADGEYESVDGEFDVVDDDGPTETPEPADAAPDPARSWPAGTIRALIEAELAQSPPHACNMMNLATAVTPEDGPDVVVSWARAYRDARAEGASSADAAQEADVKLGALVAG